MQKEVRVSWPTMKLYWRATLPHRGLAAWALLLPMSAVVLSVGVPYFASQALSNLMTNSGNFWHALLGLVVSVFTVIIGNLVGFSKLVTMQAHVMYELQRRAYDFVLARGLRFHTDSIGGKLVSDVVDFVAAYMLLSNALLISGGPLLLTIVLGLIIIFIQAWPLGIYLLGMVVLMLVMAYRESASRYVMRQQRLAAVKEVTAHTSDTIVNAQTVKTFAAETRESHHNAAISRTLRDLRIRDWQHTGRSGTLRMGLLLVLFVGLLVIVRFTARNNPAAVGISIFAFTYTMTLLLRLFEINTLMRQVEEVFLQASPMVKILSEENEVKDAPDAEPIQVKRGAVDFDNVSFAYTDSATGQRVFTKLNLHIKAGEHVGLVGPSGGGKSTLTRLLMRFEDVQDGSVYVDGQDIRLVTQASLRDAISYVPQEPLLFHRSIRENISYGKPRSSLAAIKKAASLAYAADFIDKLADGYDTVVGERGVKLSGGQRQRVAIARAILKNAPILVLDEATSALDSESEGLIQEAMAELMRGKTALVIAHRLSTIQRLDRIIVIDEGKIVEEGTHAQLLKKKNGLYARLWRHQSGGFIQE